jgi:phage-related protein
MSLPSKEVKILHVFIKKQQKTPSKEINLALKRYQKIISQTN